VNGEAELKVQEWYDAQLKVLTDKEAARKDKLIKKDLDDFFKDLDKKADAETDAYKDRIEAEKEALEEQNELRKEAYDDFSDTIQENTADMLRDWDNAWESMTDIMKDALIEMAAEAIATNIIVPVAMDIGGAMGMSWGGQSMSSMTGGDTSLLSSGASLAQNASSLWGAYSGATFDAVYGGLGSIGIGAGISAGALPATGVLAGAGGDRSYRRGERYWRGECCNNSCLRIRSSSALRSCSNRSGINRR